MYTKRAIKNLNSILIALCITILLLTISFFTNVIGQVASSVVKVEAQSGTQQMNGTGFIWYDSRHAVTALHVIAGSQSILVRNRYGITSASIERVHKYSDLALLKLERDLGLQPLGTGYANTNSTQKFRIWGYPHNSNYVGSAPIEFSGADVDYAQLSDIVSSSNAATNEIRDQGYPSLNVNIIKIASIIQHGHSGGPVVDVNGKVVAIADGGLRNGIATLNWAIPTNYLNELILSNDYIPNVTSVQNVLMSKMKFLDTPTHINSGVRTVTKVYTDYIENIVYAMNNWQLYNRIMNFITYEYNRTGVNLRASLLDVYVDYSTGASFAVPANMEVVPGPDGSFFVKDNFMTSYGVYLHQMIIQINQSPSHLEARMLSDRFADKVKGSILNYYWYQNPFQQDIIIDQPFYYYLFVTRFGHNHLGQKILGRYATHIVNGNNFVGVSTTSVLDTAIPYNYHTHRVYGEMIICLYLLTF